MKFFATLATLCAVATTVATAKPSTAEETKTLAELHAAAVAEGGQLVIYAGGDVDSQQNGLRNAWKAAYPDVNLTIVVDYSKFHDVRINNQLAQGRLVPDIAFLQTLQNFPRWASRGELLEYKPAGFSQIYEGFKDPRGAWMAHTVIAFGFSYDASQLGDLPAPASPLDLVDPKWAGKIASAYPNDDDATLFVYSQYVKKYGWAWLEQFAQQQIEFNRGTHTAALAVTGKRKVVAFGASISLAPSTTSTIKPVFGNGVPYLAWGQRLAIFKKAKRPAAAKLFLNWVLSKDVQSTIMANRSVRKDVAPPLGGSNFTWTFPDANVDAFPAWMADRAEVERMRQTFSLYLGEVQGSPSPGSLGLLPGQ